MNIQITGSEFSVGKVFSNNFALKIPPYQRPYSWTNEQAGELLNDLLIHLLENEEEPTPYFLGSIVLVRENDEANADVVDGQQRLTTLTILLSTIRHFAIENGNSRFAAALTDFLFEKSNVVLGTPDRPRLTLRELDQPFFHKHIYEVGGIGELMVLSEGAEINDAQKNILNNTRLFVEKLRQIGFERQKQLAQMVVKHCILIIISTPNLDYGYRIFSTLNERGLELSHTDVIKVEIINGIAFDERNEHTQMWERVEEMLGRKEFSRLFSHIRMIYMQKQSKNLLSEYRHILDDTTPASFVHKRLVPLGESYNKILRANGRRVETIPEQVNLSLYWLYKVNHTDWLPVAILYYTKHKLDTGKLAYFFHNLERLAFYLAVVGQTRGKRIKRYNRILNCLTSGNDVFDQTSGLQLSKTEKANFLKQLGVNCTDKVSSAAIRTILLRLDAELSNSDSFPNYSNKLTVEHVLPQNMGRTSQWLQWFDNEAHKRHVNCLGNLLLISSEKNMKASDHNFDRKKDEYSEGKITSLAITELVLKEKTWTPVAIERRQKLFVETIARLWKLS